MPAESLTATGLQTREAIELAARNLLAENGFHGTTLADITSAAGKSPAAFYRYYTDKEDLPAVLAESFLRDVVAPLEPRPRLAESPEDTAFFVSAVTLYWKMFKQYIGIMATIDQLAVTQPRFAALQHEFRKFGTDIARASVVRAQEHGYGSDLDPDHTALAMSLTKVATAHILGRVRTPRVTGVIGSAASVWCPVGPAEPDVIGAPPS